MIWCWEKLPSGFILSKHPNKQMFQPRRWRWNGKEHKVNRRCGDGTWNIRINRSHTHTRKPHIKCFRINMTLKFSRYREKSLMRFNNKKDEVKLTLWGHFYLLKIFLYIWSIYEHRKLQNSLSRCCVDIYIQFVSYFQSVFYFLWRFRNYHITVFATELPNMVCTFQLTNFVIVILVWFWVRLQHWLDGQGFRGWHLLNNL